MVSKILGKLYDHQDPFDLCAQKVVNIFENCNDGDYVLLSCHVCVSE